MLRKEKRKLSFFAGAFFIVGLICAYLGTTNLSEDAAAFFVVASLLIGMAILIIRRISNLKDDLTLSEKEIITLPVKRKKIDKGSNGKREYEIVFDGRKVEVPKAVYDQIEKGDICTLHRGNRSKLVFTATRDRDGLKLK